MKKRTFILVVALITIASNLFAQSNLKKMTETLKSQMENNEIFLESFNVYLNRSNPEAALPVAKFPLNFETETTYRIRILSDQENYEPCGIVQLVEGNVLKGTNYSVKQKKCFESFDFNNPFTREGELFVYFEDGKEGCAVVLMTKIKKE